MTNTDVYVANGIKKIQIAAALQTTTMLDTLAKPVEPGFVPMCARIVGTPARLLAGKRSPASDDVRGVRAPSGSLGAATDHTAPLHYTAAGTYHAEGPVRPDTWSPRHDKSESAQPHLSTGWG